MSCITWIKVKMKEKTEPIAHLKLVRQTNPNRFTYTMIYELSVSKKSRSLCTLYTVKSQSFVSHHYKENRFFFSFNVLFNIVKTLVK